MSARSVAVAIAITATTTTISLTPSHGVYAQAGASNTTAGPAVHTVRPTIAVLSVDDLDESGKAHAGGRSDSVALSRAEEAITQSHSYDLYARDLMAEAAKEIKLDAEGAVDPASAQKFGKSKGIQSFLQVFVGTPSARRFTGQNVSEYTIPTSGEPVTGATYVEPVSDTATSTGGIFKIRPPKQAAPATRRDLVQATVTVRCRFTQVESGKSETQSFDGIATADAAHSDPRRLAQAAVDDAFNNFTKYLAKNRTAMMANITGIEKGMAVVDMGSDQGLKEGMAFEVCEVESVAGFDSYTRVCDARVHAVHANAALLELGEYKKPDFFHKEWTFHVGDKANLAHKGCIIQEKKF
jgi:hypothetical protein